MISLEDEVEGVLEGCAGEMNATDIHVACTCKYRRASVHLEALPSSGGFSLGASSGTGGRPPRRYVPGASDSGGSKILPASPTRALVNALRKALPKNSAPAIAPRLPPPPAPTVRKRAREEGPVLALDAMQKRDRQRCLRVALIAATSTSNPHSSLVDMRTRWRADPRARFRLTDELRRALAVTASLWRLQELRKYADSAMLLSGRPRAGRAELVTAVQLHLGPPNMVVQAHPTPSRFS